ncbi:MAG: hypothetical protein WC947_08955 [Elusimicrobiota bacterium]
MLSFYLLGVLIAVPINFISLLIGIAGLWSIRSKNLEKTGLYYDIFSRTYRDSKTSGFMFVFSLFMMLIFAPALSWLCIAAHVWVWFSAIVNKTPVPEKLKEIQYKIASVELPKEKLEELTAEIRKFYGVPENDEFLEDNTFIDENYSTDGFYIDFKVSPSKMEYTSYSHTPDYDSIWHSRYKYRIDGTNVEVCLWEEETEHPGRAKYYSVKDNVVLESVYREHFKFLPPERIDNQIQQLKKNTIWDKITYNEFKYFILSKHPELISPEEYRKYLRQELERIKMGDAKARELAKNNGLQIIDRENFLQISDQNLTVSDDEKIRIFKLFSDKAFGNSDISKNEFENSLAIEKYITGLLSDKVNSKKE